MLKFSKPFKLVYANSLDAYIPELWANESVAILTENMVVGNLVHKDFSPLVANFGDIVHTRQPAEFTAKRKTNADAVTVQDADATDIQIPLDQHLHTSFMIKDGEESKSFKQLRDEYLEPAVLSIAQAVDKIILGCAYQFTANQEGIAGGLTSANIKQYILETRKRMNINKCPEAGRNLILSPTTESTALNLDLFISADKIGDEGTAMREASLGRKLQFNMFMCQNAPSSTGVPVTAVTALVDLTAGYDIGDTVIHCDTAGDQFAVGQWITIGGVLHQVTTLGTLATQDIDVTISPGLRVAIADDDVVTIGDTGLIDDSDDYAVGYNKEMTVDGIVGSIPVGTLVSFATVGTPNVILSGVYSVIAVTDTATNTTGITLNRSLDVAVTDNDVVLFSPPADVNFAFHKNAIALVSRPLAPAPAGLAISSTANMGGVGIRITITYNGSSQGVLVTVDVLLGVKVLNTAYGAALIG